MRFATLLIIAMSIVASSVFAEEKKQKTYKLPDGRVLINPYVISETPEYLEVGHNNGIIKVYLKDLPPEVQKKFHYSPEKATAFKKEELKKKQAREKQAAQEAERKKVEDEQFRRYRRDASMENLEIEIKKTENRIAELKREIPRLENNQKSLLDKTTTMATTSVAGNSNNSGYSWYGGYTYSSGGNTAGNRAERTKEKQISKLDDEYALNKHRVRTYKKELAQKEIDLIKMQNRLEKSKQAKANEKKLPQK